MEKDNTLLDFDAERRKSVNFHSEIKEGTSADGIVIQEGQRMVPERVETPGEEPGKSGG